MDQSEKRELENELMAMGLPGVDAPELLQVMADIVNGYPVPAGRVDFFCEMLNECDGVQRTQMYKAMRPRLAFDVPSLDACEVRIAVWAERMIRPRGLPEQAKDVQQVEYTIDLECGGCGKTEHYTGLSRADAMGEARKAGWGRGPVEGREHCASCRLITMPAQAFGDSLTRKLGQGMLS